jgi:hypothetical protein
VALPATAAPDGGGDPAGNNGTVKFTPHAGDDGENSAHVSCDFDGHSGSGSSPGVLV